MVVMRVVFVCRWLWLSDCVVFRSVLICVCRCFVILVGWCDGLVLIFSVRFLIFVIWLSSILVRVEFLCLCIMCKVFIVLWKLMSSVVVCVFMVFGVLVGLWKLMMLCMLSRVESVSGVGLIVLLRCVFRVRRVVSVFLLMMVFSCLLSVERLSVICILLWVKMVFVVVW